MDTVWQSRTDEAGGTWLGSGSVFMWCMDNPTLVACVVAVSPFGPIGWLIYGPAGASTFRFYLIHRKQTELSREMNTNGINDEATIRLDSNAGPPATSAERMFSFTCAIRNTGSPSC